MLIGFTLALIDEQVLLPRKRRNTSKTKTAALQARQQYLFCVRKRKIICVAKACAMIDVKIKKMFSLRHCPRTACLIWRPSELLMFVWPGGKLVPLISFVRTHLNLWLTYLSMNFAKYGLMRIAFKSNVRVR